MQETAHLHREADAILVVNFNHLHPHAVTNVDHILHLFDTERCELRHVHETIPGETIELAVQSALRHLRRTLTNAP